MTQDRENPSRSVSNDSTSLSVVLNTWLLLHVNAPDSESRTLGGLPNDFLTGAAASLLILDHVVCDEDGLVTEAAMPWVSSHIFKTLRDEGLLLPERLRRRYSAEALANLEQSGLLSWAQQSMRDELARINSGDVATKDLALPSTLRWLNSVMFAGLELPGALHYDYQENHFSNLSLSALELTGAAAPPLVAKALVQDHARKGERLLSALAIVLPDFRLLPPIKSSIGKAALHENIFQEKRTMYRYVYGDLSHAEYERYRSGPDFTERDRLVDSAQRFREADRNIEILLRARQRTASIRPFAQRVIAEVVNGSRSLEEVKTELATVRSVVDEAIAQEKKTRALQIIAGGEVLLGAAEALVATHEPLAALPATLAFGHAVHSWQEANHLKGQRTSLGRRFPLAWIAAVHKQEHEKATGKRQKRR